MEASHVAVGYPITAKMPNVSKLSACNASQVSQELICEQLHALQRSWHVFQGFSKFSDE